MENTYVSAGSKPPEEHTGRTPKIEAGGGTRIAWDLCFRWGRKTDAFHDHSSSISIMCLSPCRKKNPEVHIFGIGAQHAKDLQDVRMVGFYLTQLWGVFWGSQNIRKITVARRKLVYEVQIYQQGLPSMA